MASASGCTSDAQRRHTAGEAVQDIFDTLTDTTTTYQQVKDTPTKYFTPKINVPYSRHMFHRVEQRVDGTVGQYVTRLRQLTVSCEYGDRTTKYTQDQVIDKCRPSEPSDSSADEYVYTITPRPGMVTVITAEEAADMLFNSGASCNIINSINAAFPSKANCLNHAVAAYIRTAPTVARHFATSDVRIGNRSIRAEFLIIPVNSPPLLGRSTAEKIGALKLRIKFVHSEKSIDKIVARHHGIVTRIGCLKDGTVRLHIDKSITPVARRHSRVPCHLRQKVANEIEKFESEDVIDKGYCTYRGVRNISERLSEKLSFGIISAAEVFQHTVQTALDGTNGERNISERLSEKLSFSIISAAEVFQHTVQTALDGTNGERNISERLSEKLSFSIISAAEVFQHTVQTALDGTNGERNISERLSERLGFGINSAAEVFQHTVQTALDGTKGVRNISDDIIVFDVNQQGEDVCVTNGGATTRNLDKPVTSSGYILDSGARRTRKMYLNEITSSRRWFHPNIDGLKAEDLLLNRGKDGSFLVRPSLKQLGAYALSVRQGVDVTHIRIQSTGESYDLYGGEQFASLTELVQYYTEKCGELKERSGEIIHMKYPLLSADPTTERWFHTQMSGKTAEKLLLEKAKHGSYLVRESLSKPGDFVLSVRMENKVTHVMIRCSEGKYCIEGCDGFDNLTELVKYYRETPMFETNGSCVILEVPFTHETHVSASRFSDRIKELETKEQQDPKKGFSEEFEALGEQELKEFPKKTEGKIAANKPKNRYRNILPFDCSRVVLKDGDPKEPGSDYINANIIMNRELPECKRKYIATQGCLQTTVTDFWRMIWQQNSRIIVMTANLIEREKNKCAKYWPAPEETKDMGTYTGLLSVTNLSETTTQDYVLREFEVSFKTIDTQELSRKVYQFHFKSWPDHGVPSDPGCVLSFLQDIGDKQESIPDAGPVVVHCSAGIGRTGTVIIVDMILQLIKKHGLDCEIDVQKMTLMVRAQRSGMVQTEAQYRLIYLAVKHYIDATLQHMQAEQGNQQRHKNNSEQLYENIGPLKTDPSP
ncbi:Tyrosine-protein phosphatase non-receptor type 11 [Lamellibrachia satsuma]|nr:Tyrosine-protein phosphatase non-receptor type 11 [Lamellibrachia satsuma]